MDDNERIMNYETNHTKQHAMVMLLATLPKKKERWFHDLIYALMHGQHEDVAQQIIPTVKKLVEGTNSCCYN